LHQRRGRVSSEVTIKFRLKKYVSTFSGKFDFFKKKRGKEKRCKSSSEHSGFIYQAKILNRTKPKKKRRARGKEKRCKSSSEHSGFIYQAKILNRTKPKKKRRAQMCVSSSGIRRL